MRKPERQILKISYAFTHIAIGEHDITAVTTSQRRRKPTATEEAASKEIEALKEKLDL